MRSTFEIETEMNVVCQIGLDAAPRKVLQPRPPAVRTENDIDPEDRDDSDNDRALEQVLLLHKSCPTNFSLSLSSSSDKLKFVGQDHYFVSSPSIPATAVRAISRMDLSALR